MNRPQSIHGLSVLVATFILLGFYAVFALFQYARSRADLQSMLEEEGAVLLDALTASGTRSILAYEELEDLLQSRLWMGARLVEEMDRSQALTPARLDVLARRLDLDHIHLIDRRGRVEMGGGTGGLPDSVAQAWLQSMGLDRFITQAGTDSLVLDQGAAPLEGRYAVAVRRRRGGAVVAAAGARRLLDFRRELGPGRLIQEVGRREGIAYVVLQDTVGILLASRSVSEMGRIQGDAFLMDILARQGQGSRLLGRGPASVFETVGSLVMEDQTLGLFRIGLETGPWLS